MLYERIGRKIRARRVIRQMSQQVLAKKAGVSLSFLGHIERGTRKLSVDTLYKIAMALECSADELMETGRYGGTDKGQVRQLLKEALKILGEE